ncbi:MAG TPA: DNA-3-methyladenine glycosylase 2 family protein [Planctomycetaceae bacterium]|nr:DNA-3-methyladenine glycosylase 2 family protein [Planctomycetaceae bacterium]
MGWDPDLVRRGVAHLRRRDPVLREVIEQVGPFALRLQGARFPMLVRSILSQQISGKAARSIETRLRDRLKPFRVTPEAIASLSAEELRGVGVSPQKARSLHDLASRVAQGEVRLSRMGRMSDDEVIAELIQVRGIGVWTAQMFLMFSLGRPDVFPHDDFGIRSALKRLHRLSELPDRATSHHLASPWRPYATIASWYCWRSLDLPGESGTADAG